MHPMLVLGSIVITVSAATFAAIQVPGWIKNSQDASAVVLLDQISSLQNDRLGDTSRQFSSGRDLANLARSIATPIKTGGAQACVSRSSTGRAYIAIVRSESGAYFARTHDSTKDGKGRISEEAIVDLGGLPTGVVNPFLNNACADVSYDINA